jgi:DNA-binding protein YbaB
MVDDILRELARLQQYASSLQHLMTAAQAKAPEQAEGADSSGAVRVLLGSDGLPRSVRVEPDWRQRLDPRSVGAAVLEAFQSATGQRLAAWTAALDDDGWRAKADRLRDDPGDGPPPALRRDPPPTPPRPMDVVVEDVLDAMDHAERFANPPAFSAQGTGSAASGRVAVTLSPAGLVSCVVDASWAGQQTAGDLANALTAAFAAARADLAHAAAGPDPAARLDGLFTEALGLLTDPRRLTTRPEGDD